MFSACMKKELLGTFGRWCNCIETPTNEKEEKYTWRCYGKVHPFTRTEALYRAYGRRGSRGIALPFHDHGTRRGEGSASPSGRSLPPGKTRYPLYRRLGGPQGRSGQVRKMSPPPGFDPRTVKPVASRYTDWATWPRNGDVSKRKYICYRDGDENILRVWRFLGRVSKINIWKVKEADWCCVAKLQKNKPYRSIMLTYNNRSAGYYIYVHLYINIRSTCFN
jgi:hypothetical protein